MNSVIQCLHATQPVKEALSQYTGDCEITKSVRDVNVPVLLDKMTNFSGPNDPHEFVLSLIETFEKTLDRDLFYGVVKSKFISQDGNVTETKSEFSSLMFHSEDMNIDKPDYIIDSGIGKFSCKHLTYEKMPGVIICLFVRPTVMELPKVYKDKNLTSCVVYHPGHYVACVKENDKWFMIDDDKIYEINNDFRVPVYLALYS